jgi:hypothetical protein
MADRGGTGSRRWSALARGGRDDLGVALLFTEVVVDKVPAVDTVNDAVQTFIRPSMPRSA